MIFRSSGKDLVSIDADPKIDSDRPASPNQGIWCIAHSFSETSKRYKFRGQPRQLACVARYLSDLQLRRAWSVVAPTATRQYYWFIPAILL